MPENLVKWVIPAGFQRSLREQGETESDLSRETEDLLNSILAPLENVALDFECDVSMYPELFEV